MSYLGYSSLSESFSGLASNSQTIGIDSSSSLNRDLDINPKVAGMPSQGQFFQQQGIPSGGQCTLAGSNKGMEMPSIQYRPEIPSSNMTGFGGGGNNANGGNKYQLHWRNKTDKQKKNDNPYYFQTPYTKFFEVVTEYGNPDAINPMSLGTAIWEFNGNNPTVAPDGSISKPLYKRIQIIDEEVYRPRPYPHIGFLYTTIEIFVPYNKIGQVLSISSDITYDIAKNELTVRGMSFSYCNALLALVCLYVSGKMSWYTISGSNKPKEYLNVKNLTSERKRDDNINIIKNVV